MDLVFWYQLINRGSAQATVTFIHITVYGQHITTRQTIPTNLDYVTNMQLDGKTLTGLLQNRLYIGPGTEENPFTYAESQVTWTEGHSRVFTHPIKVDRWQNDPACYL
jgi:hypothetical protein